MLITEVISQEATQDFLAGIQSTLQTLPLWHIEELYLFVKSHNAIAISFDASWKPFIGVTRGYNEPENRTYIHSGGEFLALVRSRFKALPHEICGGRVFLKNDRAWSGSSGKVFLKWVWLGKHLSLVEDVLELLQSLSPELHQESPLQVSETPTSARFVIRSW